MFALPTRKTINKFLSEIPYGTGISEHVMHCIKSTTSFNNENKICIVAFDEISLEAGLAYSAREDVIYGFDSTTTDINFCEKMKVNLAAQVFSRTVSAVMRGIITHGNFLLYSHIGSLVINIFCYRFY